MPYRRLPNTDKARLRALYSALKEYQKASETKKAISASTIYMIKLKIKEYKSAIEIYNDAKEKQKKISKIHSKLMLKTRMYLSHFIQNVNFAILREEYPADIRKFYSLPVSGALPQLQTFDDLKFWYKKIISGEQKRIAKACLPFQNPSIGAINSIFEQLEDIENLLASSKKHTEICKNKILSLRPEINNLIKQTWNEIENYFRFYPPLIRREKAKKYGVVYVYRKNEEKIELNDLFNLN
jgi:hypothetical protein